MLSTERPGFRFNYRVPLLLAVRGKADDANMDRNLHDVRLDSTEPQPITTSEKTKPGAAST